MIDFGDDENCIRISKCSTIEDSCDFIEVMNDFFYTVMIKHHDDKINSEAEANARIKFQMFFMKGLYVRQYLARIGYSYGEYKMNPIIDATCLFNHIRSMYEALCSFELVHIIPDTDEKRKIMQNLFVICGLNERQQFHVDPDDGNNLKDEERVEIEERREIIRNSSYYTSLSKEGKQTIDYRMTSGDYKLILGDDKPLPVDWEKCRSHFGLGGKSFDDIYKFLSLHSHPSIISIRQFENAFENDTLEYKQLSSTGAMYAISLMSIFLADYSKVFPKVVETFEECPKNQRYMLDHLNVALRGVQYSILPSMYNIAEFNLTVQQHYRM